MTVAELKDAARNLGMPAFTGSQIVHWLYVKHVTSIDGMTNLSQENRMLLAKHYCIGAMPPIDSQHSKDGTIKYLFPVRCSAVVPDASPSPSAAVPDASPSPSAAVPDASPSPSAAVPDASPSSPTRFVETVFIPERLRGETPGEKADRATLCVSSQVGCKMNCLFCQTGKQGFEGNLTAADILNQIYALPERDQLTNIVFMGQGEPMDNLDAVLRATQILTAKDGYAWSPKRITVSSVGIKNKLKRFLDESDCHVAISMHSPLHEQRLSLMPAEHAMSIEDTVALLKQYDFSHQRRCSFEYICFGGLNDTLSHGREIVRLLQGLECRVNLIRFHQIPDVDLPAADEQRMEQLRDYLTAHGVFTTIRASRGQDIFAACGLLSTAKQQQLKG